MPIRLLFLLLVLTSCSSSGSRQQGSGSGVSIAANSDRFPHGLHTGQRAEIKDYKGRGLTCIDCHTQAEVVAGNVARPGQNNHAPCDDCHKNEFFKPPGAFCRVCHTNVDPRQPAAKPGASLQPYPERGTKKALASAFSHEQHLDEGAMEKAVGFHVSCMDCHVRQEASRDPQQPGHKQCARCHTGQDKAKQKLAMGQCDGCHPKEGLELDRGRKFIVGDLIFAHKNHEKDASGQAILCTTCHSDISASRNASEVSIPKMARCASCHEDPSKTPDRVRIAQCGVCHTQIASGTAPSSHTAGRSLPTDHTIEFRFHHDEAAAEKDATCRYCHTGLSGAPQDSCAQCHERMKPRDHTLAWREDAHGREAQISAQRCASCHQPDYCSSCHSIPPRSHQPMAEFKLGGHAELARFDMTSCMGCHTQQNTCANCHRGQR